MIEQINQALKGIGAEASLLSSDKVSIRAATTKKNEWDKIKDALDTAKIGGWLNCAQVKGYYILTNVKI